MADEEVVQEVMEEVQRMFRGARQMGTYMAQTGQQLVADARRLSEQRASMMEDANETARVLASRVYRRANDDPFWRTADQQEAGYAYGLAARFSGVDPEAVLAMRRIEREAQQRWGIDLRRGWAAGPPQPADVQGVIPVLDNEKVNQDFVAEALHAMNDGVVQDWEIEAARGDAPEVERPLATAVGEYVDANHPYVLTDDEMRELSFGPGILQVQLRENEQGEHIARAYLRAPEGVDAGESADKWGLVVDDTEFPGAVRADHVMAATMTGAEGATAVRDDLLDYWAAFGMARDTTDDEAEEARDALSASDGEITPEVAAELADVDDAQGVEDDAFDSLEERQSEQAELAASTGDAAAARAAVHARKGLPATPDKVVKRSRGKAKAHRPAKALKKAGKANVKHI